MLLIRLHRVPIREVARAKPSQSQPLRTHPRSSRGGKVKLAPQKFFAVIASQPLAAKRQAQRSEGSSAERQLSKRLTEYRPELLCRPPIRQQLRVQATRGQSYSGKLPSPMVVVVGMHSWSQSRSHAANDTNHAATAKDVNTGQTQLRRSRAFAGSPGLLSQPHTSVIRFKHGPDFPIPNYDSCSTLSCHIRFLTEVWSGTQMSDVLPTTPVRKQET